MSKHRLEPPPRVRPRIGRIAAAAVSLMVTGVALLGGIGVIPLGGAGSAATPDPTPAAAVGTPAPSNSAPVTDPAPGAGPTSTAPAVGDSDARVTTSAALPSGSGSGRRVVFSMTDQRVWLVNASNAVVSTYLVSGSLTDNLHAGTYGVYSRSRWAVGIDESGVMQYFVRFAHGNNAAIGFHSIPTKNGQPLQSESELGTPRSHGCIRQRLKDAELMWNFAGDGTAVVVLA